MEVSTALLLRTPLFRGIPQEALPALLEGLGARKRRCGRGEVVLRRGERADRLGLVLSGTLHIVKEDFWGSRTIVGLARSGEVFAEAYACLGGEPLEVAVLAAADAEVLFLNSVHGQRRKVLDGEDISAEMHNMLKENIESSCKQFLAGDVKDEWDFGALRRHYLGWLTTDADFHYTVADYDSISQESIADMLYQRGMDVLNDTDYYLYQGFVPAEMLGIRTADNMYAMALHVCELYDGNFAGSPSVRAVILTLLLRIGSVKNFWTSLRL